MVLEQINEQAKKYCNQKINHLKSEKNIISIKAKFEQPKNLCISQKSIDFCWFLQIQNSEYKKHQSELQDFKVSRKQGNSQTQQLTDAQISRYNEQILELLNLIHQELKVIIEDELYDKLLLSMPAISSIIHIIAKIDVTLAYVQYLRNMPNGIQICRPQIITQEICETENI